MPARRLLALAAGAAVGRGGTQASFTRRFGGRSDGQGSLVRAAGPGGGRGEFCALQLEVVDGEVEFLERERSFFFREAEVVRERKRKEKEVGS